MAVSDSSREVRLYCILSWIGFSDCSAQTLYSAFQQAVVRNVNDKNGQLQKQLDNVIREGKLKRMVCSAMSLITNFLPYNLANGEMNLMNNKKTGKVRFLIFIADLMVDVELERDLELERRKVRELQETARERDKEYQKLKV